MPNTRPKGQSAMEYLMTYGWAILIIAVVMVALYSLGLFNSANSAPRAQPGSCQVQRSVAGTNLEGQCTNAMPEFVAQFNGQNSYVALDQIQAGEGTGSVSFALWFYVMSLPNSYPMLFGNTANSPRNGYDMFIGGPGSGVKGEAVSERFYGGSRTPLYGTPSSIGPGSWYFAVIAYNGVTASLYINGVLQESAASSGSIASNEIMEIGSNGAAGEYGNYQISNFQVYNTSLSAPEVNALYDEGIGAVPIDVQNLVGWWPLNGNGNDYSGYYNNGALSGVSFTSAWVSGYTPP